MNYLCTSPPSRQRSTPCSWSGRHIYAYTLFALYQLSTATPLPSTATSLSLPSSPSSLSYLAPRHPSPLSRRNFSIIGTGPNQTVIDTNTRQTIPQGPASDGGGFGYDAPAIIWIVFCVGVGFPLAIAGIRGWRITTGIAVGIGAVLPIWAAIINGMGSSGLSDIALTCILLGFFFAGFAFGVLKYGRIVGKLLLGMEGGLALGVLIMIVKSGLLLEGASLFQATWALIVSLGVVGGLVVIFHKTQRIALLFGSASVGSFLSSLGVDLIINKQTGMSRGLRFLFDRNEAHVLDIIGTGYNPPLSSQVIIGVAIGAIPVLATAQHFIFKQPFDRQQQIAADDESFFQSFPDEKAANGLTFPPTLGSTMTTAPYGGGYNNNPPQRQVSTRSRISNGFWDSFKPVRKDDKKQGFWR